MSENNHTIRERCLSHSMEWDVYVQKRGESGRIVLEPGSMVPIENGISWEINGQMAESLLTYGEDND